MSAQPTVVPGARGSAFLANLTLFVRLLRCAGFVVSTGQSLRLAEALEWVDLGKRSQVFHAARSLLVSRHDDLALFETLFAAFWDGRGAVDGGRPAKAPRAPRHDPGSERPFTVVTYMAYKARRSDREIEVLDRAGTASDTEVLQSKDFSQMNPEEVERVRRLIRDTTWQVSERRTRRWTAARRGEALDPARTLRRAARLGGIAVELPRRRRKVRRRPMVLLADVSGSMEKYSRLLLQLFYSVSQSLDDVECFVFGTRLTRLTAELRLRNVDRALAEAGHRVVDWSGGTRIGESLGEFNRRWARRVLRRGAVVLIASDGWERGDPQRLAREMRFLRDRCHRLVWLNPLLGGASYRPLVEGMAAALPYVDDFLPVHNLQSLEQLAGHLGSLPRRRSARRGGASPRAGEPVPTA